MLILLCFLSALVVLLQVRSPLILLLVMECITLLLVVMILTWSSSLDAIVHCTMELGVMLALLGAVELVVGVGFVLLLLRSGRSARLGSVRT